MRPCHRGNSVLSSRVVQPLVLGTVQTPNKKMVLSLQSSHLLIHTANVTEVCQKSPKGVTMRLFHIHVIIKPSLSCNGNPAIWVVAEKNNKFGFKVLDAARSQALSFPSVAPARGCSIGLAKGTMVML